MIKIVLFLPLALALASAVGAHAAPETPGDKPDYVASAVAEPGVAKALPVREREVMTQLQIFLDQQNFGPGKIDGREGEFTKKALARYQRCHGLAATGVIDSSIPLDTVYPIYTTYAIAEQDLKKVGDVPRRPAELAKLKFVPYSSLLEFLEERFHCDPELLRKLNRDKKVDSLKAGDVVRVPNVAEFKVEELKEVAGLPEVAGLLTRQIRIDTQEKMLDLMEGEKLLASFPITPGSATLPAPKGSWKILGIAMMPWFRHDERMLNHGERSDVFHNIPPGPNNPVGVMWMGLNKPGIGIHGTNSPQTIGRSGSHGCIRVANWDVIKLTAMVTKGMTVVIE